MSISLIIRLLWPEIKVAVKIDVIYFIECTVNH